MLFCFLSSQENQYMIYHDSDLFCGIYNTNKHNQRQNRDLLSILSNYFDIYFGDKIKSSCITLSTSSLIISMLPLFECIVHSSPLSSLGEIKLWLLIEFYTCFLRLGISFKYGLILWKLIRFYFYHHYFYI